MRWPLSVYANEIRKILSYRMEFWINFLGQTLVSVTIAYFLWSAIYQENNTTILNGFSFEKMMLYYLIVPLVFRTLQGENVGFMSHDIYQGGLNKYLIYPISFLGYKKITYFAHSTFYILQLLLMILITFFIFDNKTLNFINFYNIFFCLLATLLATAVFFALSSILEMISFWADNVWSLGVMLRLAVSAFGGAMIPLSFFPKWAIDILNFTPFPYMVNFPMQAFFGELGLYAYISQCSILLFWYLFFMLINRLVWKKAILQYNGIGI